MPKQFGKQNNPTVNAAETAADNIDKTLETAVDGNSQLLSKDEQEVTDFVKQLKEEPSQERPNFSPDIQVSGRPRIRQTNGMTTESYAVPQPITQTGTELIDSQNARPATKKDLASFAGSLDESQIMNIPWIKPTDDIIPGILFLKPIDPEMRFHWVNFKNWEGGNYNRYRALGFVNASPDDVDQEKTPIWSEAINGTEIKWFDVILMKINVFRLMGMYKRNIMASLRMVGRYQETAKSLAAKQFQDALYAGLVMDKNGTERQANLVSTYKRMREAGHEVEFYIPGLDTKSDKDFYSSGPSDEAFIQGVGPMNEPMHT